MASHTSSIYWATASYILLGNKLEIPLQRLEAECTYDSLPSYYQEQSKH